MLQESNPILSNGYGERRWILSVIKGPLFEALLSNNVCWSWRCRLILLQHAASFPGAVHRCCIVVQSPAVLAPFAPIVGAVGLVIVAPVFVTHVVSLSGPGRGQHTYSSHRARPESVHTAIPGTISPMRAVLDQRRAQQVSGIRWQRIAAQGTHSKLTCHITYFFAAWVTKADIATSPLVFIQ